MCNLAKPVIVNYACPICHEYNCPYEADRRDKRREPSSVEQLVDFINSSAFAPMEYHTLDSTISLLSEIDPIDVTLNSDEDLTSSLIMGFNNPIGNSMYERAKWHHKIGYFYQDNYSRLLTYGKTITDNFPVIRDAIQDTYLTLTNKGPDTLHEKDKLLPYIRKCVKKRIIRLLKQERCYLPFEDYAGMKNWQEELRFDTYVEVRRLLYKFLEKIPPRQAEAYSLYMMEQYSYQEIALMMSIGEKTVRNYVSKTNTMLKALITKDHDPKDPNGGGDTPPPTSTRKDFTNGSVQVGYYIASMESKLVDELVAYITDEMKEVEKDRFELRLLLNRELLQTYVAFKKIAALEGDPGRIFSAIRKKRESSKLLFQEG